MISFSEVVNRALTGRTCSERDFDLKMFSKNLNEVAKEHGIKYDPETPVPSDNSLADEVFEAAMEFYSEVGTYCLGTERVIRFDGNEIKDALRAAPSSIPLGEGKEAGNFIARKPETTAPPWCSVGACGIAVSSEEVFTSLTQAYATLIPLADSISTACLTQVDGMLIRLGSPLEIEGAVRNVVLAREALRRAGRVGLPIVNGVATAVSDAATIAGGSALRSSDAYEIGSIAEMKVDFSLMNKVAYALNSGGKIMAGAGPLLGGYAGGPEGLTIVTAAYVFQGILVQRGLVEHPYPIHFRHVCNSGRQLLWANSLSYQAISRNTHIPLLGLQYAASGPGTKTAFYETAAETIANVVSGASIEVQALARATTDHLSPMEAKYSTELAHAVLGMKREDANDIIKQLLPKYEDQLEKPPLGKKYQECFDIKTITPSPEYSKLYKDMKMEMKDYGISYSLPDE